MHGARVVVAVGAARARATSVGEADALVSVSPDVAVAVLVADCVPVLLADAEAGVVAAVHAGRRGLVAGVRRRRRSRRWSSRAPTSARLRAAIGPAIAGESYEVPAELQDEVAAVRPRDARHDVVGDAGARPAGRRRRGAARPRASRDVARLGAGHLDGPGALLVPALAAHGSVRRRRPAAALSDREVNAEVVGRVATRGACAAVASVTGRGSPSSDRLVTGSGLRDGPERSGEGAKAMAGALRKTMLYLGLADDRSEHEEYLEEFDDQEVAVPQEYEAQVTPLHRPTRTTAAHAGRAAGRTRRRRAAPHHDDPPALVQRRPQDR